MTPKITDTHYLAVSDSYIDNSDLDSSIRSLNQDIFSKSNSTNSNMRHPIDNGFNGLGILDPISVERSRIMQNMLVNQLVFDAQNCYEERLQNKEQGLPKNIAEYSLSFFSDNQDEISFPFLRFSHPTTLNHFVSQHNEAYVANTFSTNSSTQKTVQKPRLTRSISEFRLNEPLPQKRIQKLHEQLEFRKDGKIKCSSIPANTVDYYDLSEDHSKIPLSSIQFSIGLPALYLLGKTILQEGEKSELESLRKDFQSNEHWHSYNDVVREYTPLDGEMKKIKYHLAYLNSESTFTSIYSSEKFRLQELEEDEAVTTYHQHVKVLKPLFRELRIYSALEEHSQLTQELSELLHSQDHELSNLAKKSSEAFDEIKELKKNKKEIRNKIISIYYENNKKSFVSNDEFEKIIQNNNKEITALKIKLDQIQEKQDAINKDSTGVIKIKKKIFEKNRIIEKHNLSIRSRIELENQINQLLKQLANDYHDNLNTLNRYISLKANVQEFEYYVNKFLNKNKASQKITKTDLDTFKAKAQYRLAELVKLTDHQEVLSNKIQAKKEKIFTDPENKEKYYRISRLEYMEHSHERTMKSLQQLQGAGYQDPRHDFGHANLELLFGTAFPLFEGTNGGTTVFNFNQHSQNKGEATGSEPLSAKVYWTNEDNIEKVKTIIIDKSMLRN